MSPPSAADGRGAASAPPATDGRPRVQVRPTVFGVVLAVLLAVTVVVRPPVADPSVTGLVWAGLVGVLLAGSVWPVVTARRLSVEVVSAPRDLVVGAVGTVELRLTGRAAGLSIGCSGSGMTVLDVTSPGTVRVPLSVGRRGAYRKVRVDVGSDAPFGIAWATATRTLDLPAELLVGPVPAGDGAEPDDLAGSDALRPVLHGSWVAGDSVRAVRPYAHGDPSHLVHWPSTARTGSLVVRELEPPAVRGLAVVVDVSGDDAEIAASAGAGAVLDALDRGVRVLVCTAEAGGPVAGEVTAPLEVQRRLARAVPGAPAPAPGGWPVLRLGTAGEER